MITIHPMPTRFRPLPKLELDLDVPQLRTLAFVLDRIVSPKSYKAGLCLSVNEMLHVMFTNKVNVIIIAYEFGSAVSKEMNPPGQNEYHQYISSYLCEGWNESITDKEIAAIRDTWAKHIARSIYEQIGD